MLFGLDLGSPGLFNHARTTCLSPKDFSVLYQNNHIHFKAKSGVSKYHTELQSTHLTTNDGSIQTKPISGAIILTPNLHELHPQQSLHNHPLNPLPAHTALLHPPFPNIILFSLPSPPYQLPLFSIERFLPQHLFSKLNFMLSTLHLRIHIFCDAWAVAVLGEAAAVEFADDGATAVEVEDFLIAHLRGVGLRCASLSVCDLWRPSGV
jgi:hypothetical protein